MIELDEKEQPTTEEPEGMGEVTFMGELEVQCRLLFSVKKAKKDADADFNEQIKAAEGRIEALLKAQERNRDQRNFIHDGVPDDEAEAALDAAAEEHDDEPPLPE